MAGRLYDGLCCAFACAGAFVVYRLVKYRYCDEHADRKVRIHRRRVRRKTLKAVIVIVPVVVIAVIVVYTYFMSPSNEPAEYEKVASCITNDDRLGPMVYDSRCIFR